MYSSCGYLSAFFVKSLRAILAHYSLFYLLDGCFSIYMAIIIVCLHSFASLSLIKLGVKHVVNLATG